MRGRKPIPSALKLLRGNPGKRPLPANEPRPASGAARPDWLQPAAREEWDKLATELARLGLLSVLDANALAGYCVLLSQVRKAHEAGKPVGEKTLRALDALGSAFGLSPASRARLGAAPAREEDPFEAYLGKAKG